MKFLFGKLKPWFIWVFIASAIAVSVVRCKDNYYNMYYHLMENNQRINKALEEAAIVREQMLESRRIHHEQQEAIMLQLKVLEDLARKHYKLDKKESE